MGQVAHAMGWSETEILRRQMKDLQTQIAETNKLIKRFALLADAQKDEIRALRRQVQALRDGAILEAAP
jgi:predicted  nucleic acid-binding Zn-ribbon protein